MSGWGKPWLSNSYKAPGSPPLSSRYQPPFEVRRGRWHSFPCDAGQSTTHVSTGKSDLLWRCEEHLGIPRISLQGRIGPHLELGGQTQCSPPFLTSISGSLQIWNRSQASSCVEEWNSACLYSCSGCDRLLFELFGTCGFFWMKQLVC